MGKNDRGYTELRARPGQDANDLFSELTSPKNDEEQKEKLEKIKSDRKTQNMDRLLFGSKGIGE